MELQFMSLPDTVIRRDVRGISAYPVPEAEGFLKLDAMENPYSLPDDLQKKLALHLSQVALNRYPRPAYTALKSKIREKLGIPSGYDVVVGNGSDELIAILSLACAHQDRVATVLAPVPTFVMYAVSARFAGMEYCGIPLKPDFSLDMPAMLDAIRTLRPSILYLSYPNNPTGNLFAREDMLILTKAMEETGIVVCDEAYQPFAQTTLIDHLPEHPNLVVMRTVSKLGLAGVRLGYMSASAELLTEFDKVRPPYNVNVLTEAAVLFALDHLDVFDAQAAIIRSERERVAALLSAIPGIVVEPSSANFLLFQLKDADGVFEKLLANKVLIRNVGKMHALLDNYLRLTIGTPDENDQFLSVLRTCLS